jgi:SAM-dependent methyltransferase
VTALSAGLNRWRRAQEYERGFWEATALQIATGSTSQLGWYRWRAEQLASRLRALGLVRLLDGRARVLEIGSGPLGIVSFFPAGERVAVDPLEPFYASNVVLTRLRDPQVQYRPGGGEELPCESGRYDLAIIDNCIDHVQDVAAVMHELRRVLVPAGVLYLTVNCRTRWGFWVHRALSKLRVDAGHPHTFTPRRAQTLIQSNSFEIRSLDVGSYSEALRADRRSPQAKNRIKGLLGVSEFLVTAIAIRTST